MAVESDLDFAFQLQVQEAMNASASLQPSSSLSSSSTPQFNLHDDNVSEVGYAHLLAEEIARFEQESSDRELVEAEVKKMRYDLDLRIHDEIFARDVLRVSDVEWNNTGDYFQRPYGEGSSTAAATAANAGTFRLYFKGLVSEETVGGLKTTLAGIGVAICDLRDDLVFELRKPLVGCETSSEVAEVKALIEGLNTALTLGLNRVTICCDNNSVYQCVTGKGQQRQGKVATLLDQVTLLQRKFTYCNPSFVAQNDFKFAFKLATDAIVSQVNWTAESDRGKNVIDTCVICLEDTDVARMFSVDGCLHHYCFSCMKQHVEMKLLQGMLPKCPHEGCQSMLKIESCKKFLTSELYDIMCRRIKEASIPASERVYCPYPRCSALMSKNEVLVNANAFAGPQQAGARICTKCHGLFCLNCMVPWHSNMTCHDYKMFNPYPCAEDCKAEISCNKASMAPVCEMQPHGRTCRRLLPHLLQVLYSIPL
ncbi:hypothetical protein F0562_002119 [Nyssa sinensis]|uniref:RBR-type E3 ubiquitin transferase n=1 Tax=Nyssa sinensis TaxID=561372 RepID=A0A5J5C514_9ASTE|nr:hypothetical protein F0562_002119 [Nyssa sinensis]